MIEVLFWLESVYTFCFVLGVFSVRLCGANTYKQTINTVIKDIKTLVTILFLFNQRTLKISNGK